MAQSLSLITVVVADYDAAIAFYCETLGFDLIDDTYQPEQDKRWVVVRPNGAGQTAILLARAKDYTERAAIGNQTGGRVFLFLQTDDFWRDYEAYLSRGVTFARLPQDMPYGTVAVFRDICGNLWDLIQYK